MPEDWAFPVPVIIGLAIVLGTSWDRFDEPTYTKEDKVGNKYYLRFQPRFIALRRKYGRARLVYVGFMCAAYLIVSTTPWLADFIPGLAEAAGAGGPRSCRRIISPTTDCDSRNSTILGDVGRPGPAS